MANISEVYHEQKSKNNREHCSSCCGAKHAYRHIRGRRNLYSDRLMFGLDHEYLRKFATLIALASAVTAVGIRIAVYEDRQHEMKISVKELQEKIAFLESVNMSRGERDNYHTAEIEQLRDDIKEIRRR